VGSILIIFLAKKKMAHPPNKQGIGGKNLDQSEYLANCLDIFSQPKPDMTMTDGKTITINSVSPITDDGPYQFHINSVDDEYLLMPATRLEGTVKIVKITDAGAEATCAATDDFSVVNLFPLSLFKQIELSVNGTETVDQSSSTFPYKCFLENTLSYGREAKTTHMRSGGYLDGSKAVGREEINKTAAGELDSGYTLRRKWVKASKNFHFTTPINADILNAIKLLPPGCNIKLKLIRNTDNFSIIAAEGKYKIKIKDLKLSVRKVKVDSAQVARHAQQFRNGPVIFPFNQSRISTYVIPSGVDSQTLSNVCHGALPSQIIVGFVDNAAFNGSLTGNPFLFEHQSINNFVFKVNGVNCPSTPYAPNFADDNYFKEYNALNEAIGVAGENAGVNVTSDHYKNSLALFALDLSPDMCNNFHLHAVRAGHIDIEFSMTTPPTNVLQVIVYQVYQNMLLVTEDRKTKLDLLI
jgi:hypothetical protein